MTAIDFLLLIISLVAVYIFADCIHNWWAIRSAIRQANALRQLRERSLISPWTDPD